MELDLIRHKKETEDILLSITKNCHTLIKESYTKLKGTLEFKFTKPGESCSFNPSLNLGLASNWLVGLPYLET